MNKFVEEQRTLQSSYFSTHAPGAAGLSGRPYRLFDADQNLAPSIRQSAKTYFQKHGIQWHTHSNHALSSQVCCLNFLMPLGERPEILAEVVRRAIGGSLPEMLRIEESPGEMGSFVGFEWIGGNHLNEAGSKAKRMRGANATSADAILRFRQDGRTETLLIEWKYTEKYGSPLLATGNPTRFERYKKLAFFPDGPIKSDLGLEVEDFFWEPFYQLLRQQMLAHQMEKVREDGAERVRVLHIAPSANLALRRVTSPKLRAIGSDAFAVWRSVLVNPDDFISVSCEKLFRPLIEETRDDDWSRYLAERYAFLEVPSP